ncbi:MAG: GYD domain-containing protein, partial [Trebonia sp.]|uniref:GYD domain-containing protein n=1 Tax=Trebonia sp. TaxID=2767075 RepID=UPI003BAF2A0E
VGGSVLGFWYGVGGTDVYVLGDLPDDVVATALATRVTSSGAFSSVTTTKLLTVEDMLTALGGSAATAAYRAPGEPARGAKRASASTWREGP